MRWYLAGFVFVAVSLSALNANLGAPFPGLIETTYVVILIPFVCAWAVASIFHRLHPRRMFMMHRRRSFIFGVLAAFAANVLCAYAGYVAYYAYWMDYLDENRLAADWAAGAFTLLCVWLSLIERLPKHAGFLCRACHYDLRGSLAAGRCPECGLRFAASAATAPITA